MKPPMMLADIAARALSLLDGETAHRMTVRALEAGFGPQARMSPARLAVRFAGLECANPIGLAAGFDKNAHAPDAALAMGFGFVEVGAVTPRAQPGNARPRVFRLRADGGVINRYGFNNDGLDAMAGRLRARVRNGVVGVNLGANKDSEDRAGDYVAGVQALAGLADFFTVNISSPNTPGLRALQDKAALEALMGRVLGAREAAAAGTPVFLKIAPDLADVDKADIVDVVRALSLDGLIISNTTIARSPGLRSASAAEAGGLSGRPLFAPSTALLREFYGALGKDTPLIGVGGIASARDAYEKILAGASLTQLYTALIYEGPSLPSRIVKELPEFLDADGFSTIADAVGANADRVA